jgi:RNA polymerase sigma-70 factor (ECF subfamily)
MAVGTDGGLALYSTVGRKSEQLFSFFCRDGDAVMEADGEFQQLLDRVRKNDEDAVTELIRRYEPMVRTMVRTWLRPWEARLRKVFDSADICQSVLAWFFLKGAPQRYDLARPEDLRNLFLVMVRNRVFYHARRNKKSKQVVALREEAASTDLPADELMAGRELMEAVMHRLTPEEAELAQRRIQGLSWGEIAADLGGTADGRRMQLARAAERLTRDLKAYQ